MATSIPKSYKVAGLIIVIVIILGFYLTQPRYIHSVAPVFNIDSITVDTTVSIDTIYIDTLQYSILTKDNFFLYCVQNDIWFPEVVWAQARHESGNFTSWLYRNKCNFLGLYDSTVGGFMEFSHWTECLDAYRDYVQFKYTGSDSITEYVLWLEEMGYAEDPDYIKKIDRMLRSEDVHLALYN